MEIHKISVLRSFNLRICLWIFYVLNYLFLLFICIFFMVYYAYNIKLNNFAH